MKEYYLEFWTRELYLAKVLIKNKKYELAAKRIISLIQYTDKKINSFEGDLKDLLKYLDCIVISSEEIYNLYLRIGENEKGHSFYLYARNLIKHLIGQFEHGSEGYLGLVRRFHSLDDKIIQARSFFYQPNERHCCSSRHPNTQHTKELTGLLH